MKFLALVAFSATVASVAAAPAGLPRLPRLGWGTLRVQQYCPEGSLGTFPKTFQDTSNPDPDRIWSIQRRWADNGNGESFWATSAVDGNGNPRRYYGPTAMWDALGELCKGDDVCERGIMGIEQ